MLLPALMAGVGFFFGQTVTPLYFYVSVAILHVCAFVGGWKRGIAYVVLLVVCAVLTMYTFSYLGYAPQTYHFPMQHLLRQGWNPVFDSTVEKLSPLLNGAHVWFYHVLFLPKFQELCGAIVASAFRLLSGDAFASYALMVCLFVSCARFSRRYWNVSKPWRVLFACSVTFSASAITLICGADTYLVYAAFCISALSLILYRNERKASDLLLFVASSCICMTTKTTGILNIGLLVILTLPLFWKRTAYWRALLALGFLVAVVGASPLLTNWIQYGSPFFPSMTFAPNVPVVDITCDFTGNADAMSMGYLSRICYAWVSPKLTVAAIRLLSGNSVFCPVFGFVGSVGENLGGVTGNGPLFNVALLASVILLAISRKNLITWLCVIIFVSANFAPLKCIGYSRYFPQIWIVFPLAAMNFIFTTGEKSRRLLAWMKGAYKIIVVGLAFVLTITSGMFLSRALLGYWRHLLIEKLRQNLIASIPKEIKVVDSFYRYTTVQRLRQAGVDITIATGGMADTVVGKWDVNQNYYFMLNRSNEDQSGSLMEVDVEMCDRKEFALPCFDAFTGLHADFYADMGFDYHYPDREEGVFRKRVKSLFTERKWCAVFDLMPHVLWD